MAKTGSHSYQAAQEITFTTTGNIDDLDFERAGLIRMNNASDATIRGLKAGYAGQQVVIVSIGAGHVYLAHQNTNSTAANRLINFVTSGNTPLSAGTGTCTLVYDGTAARWRLVAHEQGSFITIAYSAGNFTGSGTLVWDVAAGDQTTFSYYLEGRKITVLITLDNTTVSGTGVSLRMTTPFTFAQQSQTQMEYLDNGTRGIGRFICAAAASYIQANNNTVSNWAAATDATSVFGVAIGVVT